MQPNYRLLSPRSSDRLSGDLRFLQARSSMFTLSQNQYLALDLCVFFITKHILGISCWSCFLRVDASRRVFHFCFTSFSAANKIVLGCISTLWAIMYRWRGFIMFKSKSGWIEGPVIESNVGRAINTSKPITTIKSITATWLLEFQKGDKEERQRWNRRMNCIR